MQAPLPDGYPRPSEPKFPDPPRFENTGWHWVNSHWAAYWLTEKQGFETTTRHFDPADAEITVTMNTLRWFMTTSDIQDIFNQIVAEDGTRPNELDIDRWFRKREADNPMVIPLLNKVIVPSTLESREDIIKRYFSIPIVYNATEGRFLDGSYRVYSAWLNDVSEVLMWVII